MGLGPKNVNCVYEIIIKPMLFYGVGDNKPCHVESVLRRIILLIIYPMIITSTRTIIVILNWILVDLTEWDGEIFKHGSHANLDIENAPV